MILGLGIDLVEIRRLERALDRWGERLMHRLFTPTERESCERRVRLGESLAGTFAAKEALFKAMGTGLAQGLSWTQVEVVREKKRAPVMRVSGKAQERLLRMGMKRIWLSLSHEGAYSVAAVVIEGGPCSR